MTSCCLRYGLYSNRRTKGSSQYFPVGGIPGALLLGQHLHKSFHEITNGYVQPIDLSIMCKAENKLINDSIDSYGPADEVQCSIIGIIEDEMVSIEICQVIPSDTASDGGDVIDVRLLYHGSHRLLNRTLAKFELGMLVPYGFEIEVWATH